MRLIYKMTPTLKDHVWGGSRLFLEYGKRSDELKGGRIAESWELSVHPSGASRIPTGESFCELLEEHPEYAGERPLKILVKLIDAARPLSVQVHPTDEYALPRGGEGKAEMWYVVDAAEGAGIYCGTRRELTTEEFLAAIEAKELECELRFFEVRPGDCFFIPPGTVHAIGSGVLICEVQQSSDTTYRIYDYGRLGDDGVPRALHLDDAMAVARLAPQREKYILRRDERKGERLFECEHFSAAELRLDGERELHVGHESFLSLTSVGGECAVSAGDEQVGLSAGETVFIPACAGRLKLSGRATLIAVKA